MYNSKFITLLKALDLKEFTAFEHYLTCHHSEQKVALHIFAYVKQWYPELPAAKLEKRFAFAQIYPGERYYDRRISDGIVRLYACIKDFLIWQTLDNKSLEHEYLYLQILKKKQLDDLFFKQIRQLKKKVEGSAQKNELTYLWEFLINREHFFHTNTPKFDLHVDSLEATMAGLDEFFLIAKLKLAIEMLSRQDMLNERRPILFLEQVLEHLGKTADARSALQRAYVWISQLLEAKHRSAGEAATLFSSVKQLISDKTLAISKEDLQILTLHLVNYAAFKIRQGESRYFPEVLELYQAGLDNGALLEHGYLSSIRFLNMIDVACNLKEYEWSEVFIQTGSAYLAEDIRQENIQVGRARLDFAKGAFADCLTALREVSVKKPLLSLRVRSLYLRSFVELNENRELILANCQSFEKSLRRNQIMSKEIKLSYFNLIKMVRLLYRKNLRLQDLRDKLEQFHTIACKDWLLEFIDKKFKPSV